jgi:hypothetical protein
MLVLMIGAAAVAAACSSSTGPKPTMAGTWHVTMGSMDNGSITPTSFDMLIAASKDTFVAALPTLTWSIGSLAFDSAVDTFVYNDSDIVIQAQIAGSPHVCDYVEIDGDFNAARDTLRHAHISVGDTDVTMTYVCKPRAQGTLTVHK